MNALLIAPAFPNTFWSFIHALKFANKKSLQPPLGLLTVSSLLPPDWERRLVDLSVRKLSDSDIAWADIVFIGAMSIQKDSVLDVIETCRKQEKKIVAGGPLFTASYGEFEGVDHFVLGEAEITLPRFLDDLERGVPEPLYISDERPQLDLTPLPDWDLIRMKDYRDMNIQYSRGCPFACEFCDISVLFGRKVRTKDAGAIIAEMDELYLRGWRGGVFFVDDNFIGNRSKLKRDILPAMIEWQKKHRYPFLLTTETSIDLADDDILMDMMSEAGFQTVFVGVESPNDESLRECNKVQNRGRDLLVSVRRIQKAGFEVHAGFIIGFDSDPPSIFERLSRFIQESGIVTAMVGLLNAPYGTDLYLRLKREGRLLDEISGDNTDLTMNFVPRMNRQTLIEGYRMIIRDIYSIKPYYRRVRRFLRDFDPPKGQASRFRYKDFVALLRSMFGLGLVHRGRREYWKLFTWTLLKRPRLFPSAITMAVYGLHFRKVFEPLLTGNATS
ncbi:MAG: B12-binding domain-containing radical SAM protein [Candidatus Krumholzibacteriota bacterium]|nr:B12-binding domain-containing radical SAM protein [Candidatus Krumholzibacteriota bacterium]